MYKYLCCPVCGEIKDNHSIPECEWCDNNVEFMIFESEIDWNSKHTAEEGIFFQRELNKFKKDIVYKNPLYNKKIAGTAKKRLDEYYKKKNEETRAERDRKYQEYLATRRPTRTKPSANLPKCPTCGTTDIKRISNSAKAVNTAIFGIFGTKRHYQFECQNPKCKYKW